MGYLPDDTKNKLPAAPSSITNNPETKISVKIHKTVAKEEQHVGFSFLNMFLLNKKHQCQNIWLKILFY